jgi:hypothetical protein
MNTDIDPEDENQTTQSTFRGKEIHPYSFMYRAAFYRVTGIGIMPGLERFVYLVYLLTKTPKEVNAIRTDEDIQRFQIEAGEWADSENLTEDGGWNEVEALANSILSPVKRAESIVPDVKPSGKSGNG